MWNGVFLRGGPPQLIFDASVYAYRAFPWDANNRRQMAAAFNWAIQSLAPNLIIDEGTAENIWQVSRSVSPDDTLALNARATYLLNFTDLSQLPPIIAAMIRTAPAIPHTWLAASYYAALKSDPVLAAEYARRGLATNSTEAGIMERLRQMAETPR